MIIRTLLAGAAMGAAALATPALAADAGGGVADPQVRQFHQRMGVDIDPSERQALSQIPGDGLRRVERPGRNDLLVVTSRHAWPELFAAQVDGISRVGGDANRAPIDPEAPVHRPD